MVKNFLIYGIKLANAMAELREQERRGGRGS